MLIIAKISNPFEIFFVNISVTIRIDTIKIMNISTVKYPAEERIIRNQNDNPAVTARDLNRGEDASISILDR